MLQSWSVSFKPLNLNFSGACLSAYGFFVLIFFLVIHDNIIKSDIKLFSIERAFQAYIV